LPVVAAVDAEFLSGSMSLLFDYDHLFAERERSTQQPEEPEKDW